MNRAKRDWARSIRAEALKYKANEETIHNKDLHQRILTIWEQGSPKMWKNLMALNLADDLAYVLQQRMWTESEAMISQGHPMTDAVEQAERNHLMLEPESEPETQTA